MINHLFKNGIIVTVNPDREIFFHGAVAVKDGRGRKTRGDNDC